MIVTGKLYCAPKRAIGTEMDDYIHAGDFRYHNKGLDFLVAMQHRSSVSSILLQENRLSPLSSAGFFCPAKNPVRTRRKNV
jgi:hypothetical protein